jgi:DNA-binding MarR family transcriptional regulator
MKDQQFPPISITLPSLLRDGSDREFRRLIHSLARFAELFGRHRNMYGAYIGVSGPQYVMLTMIAGTENRTVAQIAKAMSVSSQFVANEVGKLIERNIVEKTTDIADRRSAILSLTAKGRELFRQLGPLRRDSNDRMYRSLTGDRGKLLQEILDKLIADGEMALHELQAPHRRGQRAPSVSSDHATRKIVTRATRTRS